MKVLGSGEVLGFKFDVVPESEDELLEIDNLANPIAKQNFLFFLRKNIDAQMPYHDSIDLTLIYGLIHYFHFSNEVFVSFPVDGGSDINDDSHGWGSEVVASLLGFLGDSFEREEGGAFFDDHPKWSDIYIIASLDLIFNNTSFTID